MKNHLLLLWGVVEDSGNLRNCSGWAWVKLRVKIIWPLCVLEELIAEQPRRCLGMVLASLGAPHPGLGRAGLPGESSVPARAEQWGVWLGHCLGLGGLGRAGFGAGEQPEGAQSSICPGSCPAAPAATGVGGGRGTGGRLLRGWLGAPAALRGLRAFAHNIPQGKARQKAPIIYGAKPHQWARGRLAASSSPLSPLSPLLSLPSPLFSCATFWDG